jgi:DNA polymerase alpha subunit B
MDRYMKGDNLTVVFLGGSITAGQGAVDGKAFPFWAEEILLDAMGNRVRIHNGAVPGTLSAYMSVCHNVHAPREAADIVFIDYTINDPSESTPPMDNMMRRPFERLLRKILNYPRFFLARH